MRKTLACYLMNHLLLMNTVNQRTVDTLGSVAVMLPWTGFMFVIADPLFPSLGIGLVGLVVLILSMVFSGVVGVMAWRVNRRVRLLAIVGLMSAILLTASCLIGFLMIREKADDARKLLEIQKE
jgi:hypothetical protein